MIVALENQLGELVARKIKWVNLLPGKSSISTQRFVILECVPRSLEIEGVIVKIAFERKSVLVCGTGCRVTPNQYKIRCVLSFTALTLYLHLCLIL